MTTHFGLNLRNKEGGFKLSVDNYYKIRNKDITPSSEELVIKIENALTNFDHSMKLFKTLSRDKFNEELCKLVSSANFDEIFDLNVTDNLKGFYIMVLDDYCQIYIGISSNIKKRIKEHWGRQVPLDNLNSDGLEGFRLSVDSFRALDTTRIFVRPCPECDFINYPLITGNLEDQLVRQIPPDYCLNKSYWGRSLAEILESKERRKNAIESVFSDY